jgi:hypothetical protein
VCACVLGRRALGQAKSKVIPRIADTMAMAATPPAATVPVLDAVLADDSTGALAITAPVIKSVHTVPAGSMKLSELNELPS